VALQDDRKNNADGHSDWEQNLPEFLQESIQAMVSAWDTHIKNVLILFFIQRTEKRSLGGECHALPI